MASWIGTGGSNPGDVCTNGVIGIGTSSPSYNLHVRSDNARIVNQGNSNTAFNTVSANNSDNDGVELCAYGRSASGGSYLGQNRGGGIFVGASPNAVMGVGTRNNTPLVLGTNDTERVRINSSGNMGVGTASPQATLHVNAVLRLEPQANAPSGCGKGDMFINTSGELHVHNGLGWKKVQYV